MAKIVLSAENMEFLRITEENRKELEKAGGLAILFAEWILKEGWAVLEPAELGRDAPYFFKSVWENIDDLTFPQLRCIKASPEELYTLFIKSHNNV